jgi:hypothetical protein
MEASKRQARRECRGGSKGTAAEEDDWDFDRHTPKRNPARAIPNGRGLAKPRRSHPSGGFGWVS